MALVLQGQSLEVLHKLLKQKLVFFKIVCFSKTKNGIQKERDKTSEGCRINVTK